METTASRDESFAPSPIEVVPADEFDAIVTATRQSLEHLAHDAEAAVAAADAAEVEAQQDRLDGTSATWTIVRLQRFLGEMRAEAERDAVAMVEVAMVHAQGSARLQPIAWSAASAQPPRPPEPMRLQSVPVPESAPPVTSEPSVAPAPLPSITGARSIPTVSGGRGDEPPAAVAPMLPHVAVPMATAVPPAPPAPNTEPGTPAATTRVETPRRRGFLPMSVIVEVLAVVLLLVFIVLRLS